MQLSGNIYHNDQMVGMFNQTHEEGKVQVYLNDAGRPIENAKAIVRELVKIIRFNDTGRKDWTDVESGISIKIN